MAQHDQGREREPAYGEREWAGERDWRDDRSEDRNRQSAAGDRMTPSRSSWGTVAGGSSGTASMGGRSGDWWAPNPRDDDRQRAGFVGRGPKGYQRSNERIREDVCEQLTDDALVDASDIQVSIDQGIVTLEGRVDDRRQKRRAEDVVEQVSGVRDVHNRLRVGDAMSGGPAPVAPAAPMSAATSVATSSPTGSAMATPMPAMATPMPAAPSTMGSADRASSRQDGGPWSYRQGISGASGAVGYNVVALDGSIGKIDEASDEVEAAYIVVDTGFWIFGKKRLIPAGLIQQIDHDNREVQVRLTKEEIRSAPDYEPGESARDSYQRQLSEHYAGNSR